MILISAVVDGCRKISPLPDSSNGPSAGACNACTKNSETSSTFIIDLDLQLQPVSCFDCFAGPQRSCLGSKIHVVPFRMQMSQDQFRRRALPGEAHCVREFEVLPNRFVSSERTFHQ